MKDIKYFEDHLNKLGSLLAHAEEFSDIFKYFLDHLGEDMDFIRLGKRLNSPALKKTLQSIGDRILNEKSILTKITATIIPQHQFIHGACFINGQLAIFFIFKAFSMGLLVKIHKKDGIETLLVRFTIFEAPNKEISLLSLSGNSFQNSSGSLLH
ncbi:MAG: hypothetical protein HQL94_02190 [Magnetococcales bacterium]|nr:hypothetical protein [Magnetococcales bacterium]MBF0439918.1 hypothetical protein [Magnetococcales bacterium]